MLIADPDRVDEERDVFHGFANGDFVAEKFAEEVAEDVAEEREGRAGAICSHCKKTLPELRVTVCPHCGYYAALGICIDLDEQWERLANGLEAPPTGAQTQAAPKSHLQVWIDLIPAWGWLLIGSNLAILVASVLARLALPTGLLRSAWSVTQLFAGICALFTCHFIAYMAAISEDASLNVLDILLKPIRVWKETIRALPKTFRRTAAGSCGLTAALGSVLIIGALPYGVLLDWGIEERPHQNLMGAIVAQAQKVEGDEDGLEEAVEGFAGTAGDLTADELTGKKVEKNVRVDCVIVGYTVDPRNPSEITSLVIAREFRGQLKFLGRLTEGLSEDVRSDLAEDLAEIPRNEPFLTVPAHITAHWIQPKYTCRVKCIRETEGGNLIEMELDRMLGAID